ncbi:MAG: T9SS type A sorting domain-containing protein [Bacteroidales bacterium]|nr:T9SS type A sorting domain-containing protein [Bacteroidales bacterium]
MKQKNILIITLIFSFITYNLSFAQAPSWLWAKNFSTYIYCLSTDKDGDIYACGDFGGTIKFDSIELKVNGDKSQMYIVKFSPEGKALWAKTTEYDSGSGFSRARALAIDLEGNVYVTGMFNYYCKFGKYKLTVKGNPLETADAFIVKYSSDGELIWATSAGGECGYIESWAIDSDTEGNIFFTGNFTAKSIKFDTLTINAYQNSCQGMYPEIFIAKYNTNGKALWAKAINGNDFDLSYGVATDNKNNVYITGHSLSKSVKIENDIFPLSNSRDMLLVKFNSEGKLLWMNNKYGIETYSVTTDSKGNSIVCGEFMKDTLIMNKDTLFREHSKMFTAKYSPGGDIKWAKTATKGKYAYVLPVTTDSLDNVYIGGWFTKQPFIYDTINISGSKGNFITKYDSSGNFIWVKSVKGAERLRSIHCDKIGNIYSAGEFTVSELLFDTIVLLQNNKQGFIAKLAPSLFTTIKSAPETKTDLLLYPNPCTDELYINVSHFGNVKHLITVYDIHGTAIFQTQTTYNTQTQSPQNAQTQATLTINTRSFPPGLYLTRIQSSNSTTTRKFIKF